MIEVKFTATKQSQPLTADILCRCLTGKGISEFAEEIVRNESGKYDKLFSMPTEFGTEQCTTA